jgi:hypothetical protein
VWTAPALGKPCDNEKATTKAPKDLCEADSDAAPADSSADDKDPNGNAYGHGSDNGNAYGHDKGDDPATGPGGNAPGGNAPGENGPGSGSGGDGSTPSQANPSAPGRTKHEPAPVDPSPSPKKSGTRRDGKASTTPSSSERVAERSTSTPAPVAASVEPATHAAVASPGDWDTAGPQLASGLQPAAAVPGTGRLFDAAVSSAEALAFPLLLAVLVCLFLLIQGFLDRNDPKLKYASVTREVYDFS